MDALQQLHLLGGGGGGTGGCMDALQQLHLLGGHRRLHGCFAAAALIGGGGTGGCMDALQQLHLLGGHRRLHGCFAAAALIRGGGAQEAAWMLCSSCTYWRGVGGADKPSTNSLVTTVSSKLKLLP